MKKRILAAAAAIAASASALPAEAPGSGVIVWKQCAILNLQGRTYMPNTDCPFRAADRILAELDPGIKVRFVDFHAEVTS